MNRALTYTNRTLVKTLIILTSLISIPAAAQPAPPPAPAANVGGNSGSNNQNQNDFDSKLAFCQQNPSARMCEDLGIASGNSCEGTARAKYDEAKRNIAKSCSAAGIGGNAQDCAEQVMSCDTAMSTQDFNSMAVLSQVVGVQLDAGTSSGCPQLSGKDFYTEKRTIDDQMDDINKELAQLEKDKAAAEKEFNEKMQEVQKEIREAQKELEDEKLKISEETRQQAADFAEQQASTRSDVRKKNMDLLQLKGKLIKSDRERAINLIKLSESATKRACTGAIKELRDKILKPGSKISVKDARAANKELSQSFDDCMKNFDQQRATLNESYRQEQEELNTQIAQLQSDIDDIEGQLELASNQLKEMEADAKTRKNTAEQNLVKMMQEAQQKMTAAQDNLKKEMAAMTQEQNSLKGRLTKLSNELALLGPTPADRSSEDSPKKALANISPELDIINDYEDACGKPADRRRTLRQQQRGAR